MDATARSSTSFAREAFAVDAVTASVLCTNLSLRASGTPGTDCNQSTTKIASATGCPRRIYRMDSVKSAASGANCRSVRIQWTRRMGNIATLSGNATIAAVLAVFAGTLSAQAVPEWRHVGNSAIELGLAGLASGPVERVWFNPDGAKLMIRTGSGKAFET